MLLGVFEFCPNDSGERIHKAYVSDVLGFHEEWQHLRVTEKNLRRHPLFCLHLLNENYNRGTNSFSLSPRSTYCKMELSIRFLLHD